MCKQRIEKSLDTKGVKFAEWDIKTHVVTVVYSPKKISEKQLHQKIIAIGHSTDQMKTDSKAYNALPQCCQYVNHKD